MRSVNLHVSPHLLARLLDAVAVALLVAVPVLVAGAEALTLIVGTGLRETAADAEFAALRVAVAD